MKKKRRIFSKIMTAIFSLGIIAIMCFLPCIGVLGSYKYDASGSAFGISMNKHESKTTYLAEQITPLMMIKASNSTKEDLKKAEEEYNKAEANLKAAYIREEKDATGDKFKNELANTKEAAEYYSMLLFHEENLGLEGEYTFDTTNIAEYTSEFESMHQGNLIKQAKLYSTVSLVVIIIAGLLFALSIVRIIVDVFATRLIGVFVSIFAFLGPVALVAYPFLMTVTGKITQSLTGYSIVTETSFGCEPMPFAFAIALSGLIAMIFGLVSCRKYKKAKTN